MTAMREYGLREPEFIDMEIGFRVNLYRMTEDEHLVMQDTIRDTDQTIQDTDQTIQDTDQTIQDTIQDADQTIQDTTQGTDQAALKAKLSGEKLTDKEREILLLIKKQHVLERQGNNQKGLLFMGRENTAFDSFSYIEKNCLISGRMLWYGLK